MRQSDTRKPVTPLHNNITKVQGNWKELSLFVWDGKPNQRTEGFCAQD